MEPRKLEGFLGEAALADAKFSELAAGGTREPMTGLFGDDDESSGRPGLKIENGVAVIDIKGVLLKKVPQWVRWWGISATGYDEIRTDLAEAVASRAKEIRLRIESPGGQVAGSQETADAIHAAGKTKPISAEIEDMGASGAYWLASQALEVSANPNAIVGSIGVYTAFVDSSRAAERAGFKVHLIASGPHKGMGTPGVPISEEQLAGYRRVVDGMAEAFVASVARGRRVEADLVRTWATGQVWLASQAKAIGLIDDVRNITAAPGGVTGAAALERGAVAEDRVMDHKDGGSKAVSPEEAVKADRARLAALKAAFPEDLAFALSEFEKGASVESAKAAYADVLQAKLSEERAEKAKLEARLKAEASAAAEKSSAVVKIVSGSPPVSAGADPEAGADFMEAARRYSADKKIGITQAMSYIARTRPKLHADYLAAQQARAPEVRERKIKLGIA
jgi:protease-4